MTTGINFYQRLQGQNFLTNPAIVERLANVIDLNAEDVVLEIGAGTGNICVAVAPRVSRIYAIEKDAHLFMELARRTSAFSNVTPVFGDFFMTHELWDPSFRQFPIVSKIVSNMPFSYAESILCKLAFIQFDACGFVLGEEQLGRALKTHPMLNDVFEFTKYDPVRSDDFFPPQTFLCGSGQAKRMWIMVARKKTAAERSFDDRTGM